MTELPNTRKLSAPAKINPFLRVLGRREDGYHDLESVVLPISLADELEIHAANDPGHFRTLSLSLEVTGEPEIVRGVPVDESNLVMEAAKALADRTGVRGFAEVHLHKRIPAAAGLGGGSADAAATMSALNDLWGLGLDPGSLRDLALDIGSDIPALVGRAPVLIRGRGEVAQGVSISGADWAVATFNFGVSTRDAYQWWDEDDLHPGPGLESVLSDLGAPPDVVGPLLFNDLEMPVISRRPDIGRVKEIMLEAGAAAALMSGSGPTVVGLLSGNARLSADAERDIELIAGRPVSYAKSATWIGQMN